MHVRTTPEGLVGTCTLGIAHEGPPGFGHGGMSAMLLDELMGQTCGAAGAPAMTIDLKVRYHGPVLLQTPLHLTARIIERRGRKLTVHGTIATAADPATVLVDAHGAFLEPAPDQVRALFPGMAPDRMIS